MTIGVVMFKKIYVEITNVCNLNCCFCHGTKRKKEFISLDNFKKLLEELKGYTKYLYFHVMGEPLLHPVINELIDVAHEEGFLINLTSNGYFIKKIMDNKNVRQVNVSLHGFALENGKSLNEYFNDLFEATDKMVQNGTYISYRLWAKSPFRKEIISKLEEKYHVAITENNNVKLSHNIFLEFDNEFIWPDLNNDYFSEDGSCLGCRSHIGVLVDGTVVPCCLDSEGLIRLGNIYKQKLDDIINSELFINIKNGFLNNKKIHELCKHCNFYDLRR